MSQLAAVPVPQTQRGPRFTYKVPASARIFPTDPESVTLVPLTLEQDMHGNRLLDQSKNVFDKIKLAVVAINGKVLSWGPEMDKAIDGMSPKCRELLGRAYAQIHAPDEAEAEDFLGSRSVEV
jgi:hypothetical protein